MKTSNPTQYAQLNEYYNAYGAMLRLPPIQVPPYQAGQVESNNLEVPKASGEAVDSRASVHSGQSSNGAAAAVANKKLVAPIASSPNVGDDNNFYMSSRANESTIYGDPNADPKYQPTFQVMEEDNTAAVDRLTPVKFASPHVKGAFGALGLLSKVSAKSPLDGQSASVEMHSLQTLLHAENRELREFPGPLVIKNTHKGEVIQFCQAKIQSADENPRIVDKESYKLLWELLILLLRQKNAIDGSDIAELLLRGRDKQNSYEENQLLPNGGDDDEEDVSRTRHDRTVILSSKEETAAVTAKFRDYLLFGHKKEGLEFAMSRGLWGHALFLASKMDERSYSNVMLRFANGLAVNDPLQTLYQLMSGRQPIAVKECADKQWGDWRPHLAMILSNPSGKEELDRRSIITLGDTLFDKGFLYAAHFCYLMTNTEFGGYSTSTSNNKLVLIGADRTAADITFDTFASNESIQCTEVFEYVQKLSNPDFSMASLQYFKFVYALRLLDAGMSDACLHYLEQIARVFVAKPAFVVGDRELAVGDLVLRVLDLADRLKFLDPMYTTREGERSEMGDPEWLTELRSAYHAGSFTGNYTYQATEFQQHQEQQYYENYYGEYEQHQQQEQPEHQQQGEIEEHPVVEQQSPVMMMPPPPAEQHADIPAPPIPSMEAVPPSSASPTETPSSSAQTSPTHLPASMPPTHSEKSAFQPPQMVPEHNNYFSNIKTSSTANSQTVEREQKAPTDAAKPPSASKNKKAEENSGPGMFGRLLGRFIKPPNQMHLPDEKDNQIVWDEDRKRWVDLNADPEEEAERSKPPPSDMELSSSTIAPPNNSTALPPAAAGGNKFVGGLAKKRGGLAGRVDVFKKSQASSLASGPPMSMLAPPGPLEPSTSDGQQASESGNQGGAPPMMLFNPNQFGGAPEPAM